MKFDDGKTYTAIFFKSVHDLEKQFNALRMVNYRLMQCWSKILKDPCLDSRKVCNPFELPV